APAEGSREAVRSAAGRGRVPPLRSRGAERLIASRMTFMRGSALVGVSAGLFVLGFTLVWAFDPVPTSTPLDGAYAGNAVLALEFARSTNDVERVIGPRPPTPEDQAIRDRLDALNRHDHVYMLAYGGLLVAGFVLLLRVRRCALPALGAALVATGVAF